MDTEKKKLLLKVAEAADLLSIARSRAYAMVQAGELPSIKLGKSVRVPVAALDEYIHKLVEAGAVR